MDLPLREQLSRTVMSNQVVMLMVTKDIIVLHPNHQPQHMVSNLVIPSHLEVIAINKLVIKVMVTSLVDMVNHLVVVNMVNPQVVMVNPRVAMVNPQVAMVKPQVAMIEGQMTVIVDTKATMIGAMVETEVIIAMGTVVVDMIIEGTEDTGTLCFIVIFLNQF